MPITKERELTQILNFIIFSKDTSSVKVILIFHGTDDAADLPQMVEDNIRQYAPKTNATKDENTRQIGHTIIWLNSSLVSLHAVNVSDWTTPMPTTTTQMTTPDWSILGGRLCVRASLPTFCTRWIWQNLWRLLFLLCLYIYTYICNDW